MKVKLLSSLFLLSCQFSFSQNKELLQGTVFNQNKPIPSVEVINFNTKAQTTTDQKGNFSIVVKMDDLLVFISKDYELKKLVINQKHYDKNNFLVYLNLKPEELKEVVITKMASIKLSTDLGYEQKKLDDIDVEKRGRKLRTGVYDGTIENGPDLMRIGGMFFGLFIKEKESRKETKPDIEFAVLAKNTCDKKFYLEKLKLKPEEIDLFLQFCDADPISKTLIEHNNLLSMMDFLSAKNIEFQKLNSFGK
jgi:hypothetical protein